MIEIRRLHRPYGIEMKGHAGAAVNAQEHDLVCCAASTLIQTLLYSLSRQEVMVDHDVEDGYMRVSMHDDRDFGREVAQTFMTVEDGLEMLATAYPECIRYVE